MMRLSTMWTVDRTVRDDGSSPVAERILEGWAHEGGSVRFFRSSANFLYVFQRDGEQHFLRFADSSERSRETIEAEVDLLGWLAGAGIDVPVPVPSRHGNLLETIGTDRGEFHAVVFPAMSGEQFEIGDLDDSGFRRWGAALGQLHAAMREYRGPGSLARSTWSDHLEVARLYLVRDTQAPRDELEELTSSLAALPSNRETYGLIHFDFELDNLIWRDGSIGILDFDDCSHLWYAADLAFALGDLFAEGADFGDERSRAFVRGYAEHHPLDDDLMALLPLFRRLNNLLKYARLLRATDLPVGPEHPDWLVALSQKLHDRMAEYLATVERKRT